MIKLAQKMTNKDYKENIARLKQIEAMVKDPEASLDKIDELLEETKQLVEDCHAYTRTLREKTEVLSSSEN